MNSYYQVTDTANYSSPFQKVDEKRCYENRDAFYDCLDKHNDLIGIYITFIHSLFMIPQFMIGLLIIPSHPVILTLIPLCR